MTAEIVVMNRQAVALAADSAVTYNSTGGRKHFQSANKIFTLSKYHPVGLMVFGSAEFMGVPWETIIKDFRERLRDTHFSTLGDYATRFLAFLESNRTFSPADVQQSYYRQLLLSYFDGLRDEIQDEWKAVIDARGSITTPEYKRVAKKVIERHRNHWRDIHPQPDTLPDEFPDELRSQYKDLIVEAKKSVFEKLLTSTTSRWLTELSIHLGACAVAARSTYSGLVIAGFGTEDVFPKQRAYSIGAVLANRLLYIEQDTQSVAHDQQGIIGAYAQGEMVASFMEGIDPRYRTFVTQLVSDLVKELPEDIVESIDEISEADKRTKKDTYRQVGEELLESFRNQLETYSRERHIDPVVAVVSVLPKDELAQMARSLVYLTVLKRRVSLQEESVAEPIDVAVISKGDGFVWVERKHYFDPDLNQHFMDTYFRHWLEPISEGDNNE